MWYIILPLFYSRYFSQEITLGKNNRLNFPPPPPGQRELGQRGAGHFNTKTIQYGPICPLTFNGYIFHTLIPVNESILVLCPSKHVTIYINFFFFISVLLGSLQCTHLCIKIIKSTKVGVAPLPNAPAPFAQAIGQRGPL